MHNGYGSGDVDIQIYVVPGGVDYNRGGTPVTIAGQEGIYRQINDHDESWTLDLEGTSVTVKISTEPGTSESDLAEARAIVDSIRTGPRENSDGLRVIFMLRTDDWDSG
ncbi:MAG TPA: hypothetical protein VIC83_07680 [Candidatus Limnocylindria bacterium]|jgi:hypothetical protein